MSKKLILEHQLQAIQFSLTFKFSNQPIMKIFHRLLILSIVLLIFSCKSKDKHSETDNLFKFKEYISYNTYGNQSISTNIKVGLAKPLEQFEMTQELKADDYLKISPKVDGKLAIENGNTLIFVPSE